MAEKLLVPIYLPRWLHEPLLRIKRAVIPRSAVFVSMPEPGSPISGERNIEWSFLSREMPDGPGEALDFGCEYGYMSLFAGQKGFHVLAVDLQEKLFTWSHPLVDFRQGDFLKMNLPRNHYNLVINCSSVEHVGITGRYGVAVEQNDGDIEVMQRFAEILKPKGLLLMTTPCGRDAVLAPWNRVYGRQRLPKLLGPFRILKESYWIKDAENRWVPSTREAALDFLPVYDPADGLRCAYALSGFVLQKP
jgi:SAM-dependent methyltransferase